MSSAPVKLKIYAEMLEKELERLMPKEECLQSEIFEACRYSLLEGGKRLRPFFSMTFFELCGGKAEDALSFAAGIEMIQSYSLIHDDLPCMDDSDYRRGKLSNHKVYGYSTAVLAGDALLNRAFEVFTSPMEGIKPLDQLAAANVMGTASGVYGMVGGQVVDLALENRQCTAEELEKMVSLKTGALIAGSCKSGCCLAGASPEKAEAAYNFGMAVGLAFQIRDDMLDLVGTSEQVGKPMGSDAENNKNTYASVYGLEKCEQLVKELTDKALESASVFGEEGKAVLSEIALWLINRTY